MLLASLLAVPAVAQAPQVSKPRLNEFTKWTKEIAKTWGEDAWLWSGKAEDLTELITGEGEFATLLKRMASGTHIALGRVAFQDAGAKLAEFLLAMDGLTSLNGAMVDAEDQIAGMSPELGLALKKHAVEGMKLYNQALPHRKALTQWADKVAGKAEW